MHVPQVLASALLVLTHINGALALPATDATVARDDSSAVSARDATIASTSKCKTPLVRKEWRALSKQDRLNFLNALKCLQAKPAKTGSTYAGAKSRYDDYQALHIHETDFIHFDGVFLPWHRYMLYLFEQDLRSTCGYTGTIPYWNWSLDAVSEAAVLNSPIFDPTYGFGGNGPYIANVSGFPADWQTVVPVPGRLGGGCITDGPFASRQVPMGPANHTEYTPHCLRRDISPYLITVTANATCLNWALDSASHFELDRNIEGFGLAVEDMRVHAGGHIGVGGQIGDMANMYSSPGDPLFWVHHSMIDHVWDQWQRKNFAVRSKDISGPDTMWAYPYNYFGDIPYKNITLQTALNYPLIASSIKVSDIMDTQGGLLCYTYA